MVMLIAPLLFIAVVLYVAYPLLQESPDRTPSGDGASEVERLEEEKESIIANLKDLEMDFRTGKLSPEDYQNLKGEFEERAFAVFQLLEKAQSRKSSRRSSS